MSEKVLKVRVYHGTTLEAAIDIRDKKLFQREDKPWHWLGYGIYFWQDAELRAWEWALSKAKEISEETGKEVQPAVISGDLILKNCIDLLDIQHTPIIKKSFDILFPEFQGKFDGNFTQIPPHVALNPSDNSNYGNNRLDCAIINKTIQLIKESNASESVVTIRGAFMEGDEPYPTTWLRDRSHVQIAVIDPTDIESILDNIIIEDNQIMDLKYKEIESNYSSDWGRWMNSQKSRK